MSAKPHTIRLAGQDTAFACAAGDTLLRAALRHGLGLSYECNAGACGSCKIELIDGELMDLFPEATGLRPRERERGRRLACQSAPVGDCTIKARLGEEYVPRHRPQRCRATLEAVRDITHDIREFSLRTGTPARFLAGQYAMLALPGAASPRAYSMSNLANDQGLWQFMVRRVPRGAVSNALFALTPGVVLELDGPYGLAFLREDSARDIVCIAGGSGLAPMVSILDGAASHPRASQRGAWLFYGGRGPRDVPDVEQALRRHGVDKGLHWHPIVSLPELAREAGWTGEVGFVHELLARTLPQPLSGYEYYLAGPPPMIEAAVRLLTVEHKVPQSQLHFDRFF
jgi:toluene monooxygenase electron transfer component